MTMKKKRKQRRALWITAVSLALFSVLFFFLAAHLAGRLTSQQEAERWQGESTLEFSQISCFLPADEKLTLNKVYAFREQVAKALHEASVDVEYTGQLQLDAWSTTGKVSVSTDLGKGEARVIAVGGDFFQFHPIWLASGNYISQSDFMQDRVLLDEELAWMLFGGTELTGMQLKINGVPFVVAGVIQREQDMFSRRAYTDGMGLFMSFDAYRQLNEDAGIDCYEFVMGEPVKGFALNLTREKFPIGRGEILQNTGRFTFSRLWKILEAYGTRSMQTRGIIYPYWENACRSAEDECALFMLLGFLFAVYPLVLVTVTLVHLFKSGKEKLTEEILPDVSDRVEEAVRVRQRRAWERQQERRGKHEK